MITVSIETAKKLKEQRYPQKGDDSYFTVLKNYGGEEFVESRVADEQSAYKIICDAPTAQELMENMPAHIDENDNIYDLTIIKVNDNYWVAYNKISSSALISFDGNSLCECLANLWLWCREEGYIKI